MSHAEYRLQSIWLSKRRTTRSIRAVASRRNFSTGWRPSITLLEGLTLIEAWLLSSNDV
jgi:nucleoside-diphosphate-sugar epimerase